MIVAGETGSGTESPYQVQDSRAKRDGWFAAAAAEQRADAIPTAKRAYNKSRLSRMHSASSQSTSSGDKITITHSLSTQQREDVPDTLPNRFIESLRAGRDSFTHHLSGFEKTCALSALTSIVLGFSWRFGCTASFSFAKGNGKRRGDVRVCGCSSKDMHALRPLNSTFPWSRRAGIRFQCSALLDCVVKGIVHAAGLWGSPEGSELGGKWLASSVVQLPKSRSGTPFKRADDATSDASLPRCPPLSVSSSPIRRYRQVPANTAFA
jgi:hypothetical protein